jgi:hypothetical protein
VLLDETDPNTLGFLFEATVPLQPGPNQITVVARDAEGRRAVEQVTVIRSFVPGGD